MIRTEDEDYIEFHSEKFEKILNTEYMCDVPYKIDLKKYNEVMENYSLPKRRYRISKPRNSDIDTMVLNFEKYYPVESEKYLTWNLYVERRPKLYVEKDDDCDHNFFQFSTQKGEDKTPESVTAEFEQCLRDVLDCIIGIDEDAVRQYLKDVNEAIAEKQKEIVRFKTLIDTTR